MQMPQALQGWQSSMPNAEFWKIVGSVVAANFVGRFSTYMWLREVDSVLAKLALAAVLGGVYSGIDPLKKEPGMSPTAVAGYITGLQGFMGSNK